MPTNKLFTSTFLLATLIQLAGCVSSKPIHFTIASVEDAKFDYEILKKGVEGKDCEGQYGSYEVATRAAITSVKGANALANAKFSRKEVPIARICVSVVGDAVKI
ncbi:MAG: hypothetical protein AAF431_12910 [Pseudomonadota bacterium]